METGELAWVLETPGNSGTDSQRKSLYNETGARRRRAHQKSRRGCANCKQRRVKCDEIRPSCGQCDERKWPCGYPDIEPPKQAKPPATTQPEQSLTPPTSVSEDAGSPAKDARDWLHMQVLACLEKADGPSRQIGGDERQAFELVDHFIDYKPMWIGSPTSQGIIQKHGLPMALEAPYLLHAMLACAAKHLSFLHPDVARYDAAATLHYTRSLQAYSGQLVYDLEHGNANAMMAASGLLAKLTFINTPTTSANRPLSADSGPTWWIRSMQGIRTILSTPRLRAQLEQGFMLPILQRYQKQYTEAEIQLYRADSQIGSSTLSALESLCDVHNSASTPNPYTTVLKRLEPLLLIPPSHVMVDQFMAFIATLEPSFIQLLEDYETKALLILAMWCARLPLIDQWWTGPSARIECRRICAHLCRVEDQAVRTLLEIPARSCGFQPPETG